MIFHGRNQFFRVDVMFSKNHSRKANHVSLIFLIAALYLASYESEGPENNMEKDRWKSLRCVWTPSPSPVSLCTHTHTLTLRGLESFNHGCHPTSPPASPLTRQAQRDVGHTVMLTCTLFNKCIKHTHTHTGAPHSSLSRHRLHRCTQRTSVIFTQLHPARTHTLPPHHTALWMCVCVCVSEKMDERKSPLFSRL